MQKASRNEPGGFDAKKAHFAEEAPQGQAEAS